MPPVNMMVGAVITVTALILIGGTIGWLLDNPVILVVLIAAIAGGVYFMVQAKNKRNRV